MGLRMLKVRKAMGRRCVVAPPQPEYSPLSSSVYCLQAELGVASAYGSSGLSGHS